MQGYNHRTGHQGVEIDRIFVVLISLVRIEQSAFSGGLKGACVVVSSKMLKKRYSFETESEQGMRREQDETQSCVDKKGR